MSDLCCLLFKENQRSLVAPKSDEGGSVTRRRIPSLIGLKPTLGKRAAQRQSKSGKPKKIQLTTDH
jgi:hypothetical protein